MWKLGTLVAALILGTMAVALQSGVATPQTVNPVEDFGPTKAGSYNWTLRHQQVLERIKSGKVDLLLIGDSITHMWGGEPKEGAFAPPGHALWEKYFGSRNAVNLGFGWDRTQHVLWRLQHGELDGISPKTAVIMIGTNNLRTNSTDDIVTGITAIVDTVHWKLPHTKVLLLGIFPRDAQPNTRNRMQIAAINEKISNLGKRDYITYLDLTTIFLQPDGTISHDIMGDYLHPTPKGYQLWANAMEPTLAKLMGDKPRS